MVVVKRHERSLARRMALQALYQGMILGDKPGDIKMEDLDFELPDQGALPEYAVQLVGGVQEHMGELDAKLDSVSQNWPVERMPLVDRAIMRLATYEMLYEAEVPVSVSINEAVELAKEFGGQDDSARFANGVLGRIARTYAGQDEEDSVGAENDAAHDGEGVA